MNLSVMEINKEKILIFGGTNGLYLEYYYNNDNGQNDVNKSVYDFDYRTPSGKAV